MNPFRNWKVSDVAQFNSRSRATSEGDQELARTAVTHEADLHNDILAECRRRGWIPFHGSMAHSTFRTPGEPDFVILADGGRLLLVECKTKTGKLSADQQAIAAWARKLGFQIHIVRSFAAFLTLANHENTPSHNEGSTAP